MKWYSCIRCFPRVERCCNCEGTFVVDFHWLQISLNQSFSQLFCARKTDLTFCAGSTDKTSPHSSSKEIDTISRWFTCRHRRNGLPRSSGALVFIIAELPGARETCWRFLHCPAFYSNLLPLRLEQSSLWTMPREKC